MTKKRTKKYNPHKAKDIISKFEWIGSIYYQFYDKLYTNVMQNKCTVQTLVEDIAQLHRLTFLPCDYDLSEVRQLIEDLFDQYLTGHDVESAESIADQPVDIKDTELL